MIESFGKLLATRMHLHIEVLGDDSAPAVLFISGFVGSSRVWDEHFRSLSHHYRLLLIDTLGFGQSPKPHIDYTVDDHVDAIHETLQSYDVSHVHIVGHSMGCLLALAYANRYPAQSGGLALLALLAFESEAQARETIRNNSLFNRLLAMDQPLARFACALMCVLRPLLRPIAPRLVRDVPAVVAKDALSHHWDSYSKTLRNVVFKSDSARWLRETDRPILLVHGTHDHTAPFSNIQKFTRLPNVQFLALDSDHGIIFSHSREIAAKLTQFLEKDLA